MWSLLLLTLSLLQLCMPLVGGASLAGVVNCTDGCGLRNEWEGWMKEHGRVYGEERELVERYAVWAGNRELIRQHNENSHLFGYTLRMNHFGDLTNKEFVDFYQCVQTHTPHNASSLNTLHNTDVFLDYHTHMRSREGVTGGAGDGVEGGGDSLPDSMDWRTSGIITKVKDQLRCGSSYAFSSMASLEGIHALAYRSLAKLSEQNIVDCSVAYGNHGCACGEVNKAFLYVIDNQGVDTWDGYPSGGDPYRSKQYSCKYDERYRGASARGVVILSSGSEASLKAGVANMGPVSVYVDATSSAFQFYADGVLNVPYCSSTYLSHALVVIGYGTMNGQDYWLVKNSWGPNWGVWGYGMLARNKGNQCGIATSPSVPSL